ncbi:hypothetical protein EBU99_06905 [bacterium]|nr:hypothetical protein [bacterium]
MSRKIKTLRFKKVLAGLAFSVGFFGTQQGAHAVPLSFLKQPSGTQADVTWGRLENSRFVVYYDSTQKTLAQHALSAVEDAYPDYSLLLGTRLQNQPNPPELDPQNVIASRFEKIPVIVSARSDGASFANFIPQTLEIQSTYRPPRALFQHELAHRMMYEHLDLSVGPAGRTFMMAMLPTWWTEGLPEYLTESLGRLETNGYLRAMVLNNTFLSWDRLHALYKASGETSILGYATAGKFFKYFLERTPEKNLRTLHQQLKYSQLIPPFFSGAYLLLHKLTGQWPGELYESFKKDITAEVRADLEGMPLLRNILGAQKVFDQFAADSYLLHGKTLVTPDFATESRAGGLKVFKFKTADQKEFESGALRPLKVKAQDRIYSHHKEWSDGGFWTTSRVKAENRTVGHAVSYYLFKGDLNKISDDKIISRFDFPMTSENAPALVRDIAAIAPEAAAVVTNKDTESKLYILNATLKQHVQLAQWSAPTFVRLVRPHDAHAESESSLCAFIIVDQDSEKTSLQRACHGESPKEVIPAGTFVIRSALMLAPDDFVLLVGWNDAQALVRWTKGNSEIISGMADWVDSIEPADTPETLMLRVFTGQSNELWKVSLKDLHTSHLAWIANRPETSKWWNLPGYVPYVPPFARYANELRKSLGRPKIAVAENTTIPKNVALNGETDVKSDASKASGQSDSETVSEIPAPYRFKHWMTYPNFTPPFLSGVWNVGLFSRPFVDEMERFYVQLFGSYMFDSSILPSDRWGLEANLYGNRLFDGWKANLFMRPRFNGLAYTYPCRSEKQILTCAENRRSVNSRYVSTLLLRETGADARIEHEFLDGNVSTDVHAKVLKIDPSSSNDTFLDPFWGAQQTVLASVGSSLQRPLWSRVFFDAPLTSLSKRDISAGGRISVGVDTTHSLTPAKAGDGSLVSNVSYQNYSVELMNQVSYRGQSLSLRNTYSSTGGGSPLNYQEFFQPFKTYVIGTNDGLQNISTSLLGNGLLSYNLVGRAQYRNSLSYSFPIVNSFDTRLGLAYLEGLDGELVLSRGGVSDKYLLSETESISTLTASMRLNIDVKGYGFYPAILYGKALDKPLWQLFMQLRFDQFW